MNIFEGEILAWIGRRFISNFWGGFRKAQEDGLMVAAQVLARQLSHESMSSIHYYHRVFTSVAALRRSSGASR